MGLVMFFLVLGILVVKFEMNWYIICLGVRCESGGNMLNVLVVRNIMFLGMLFMLLGWMLVICLMG